MVAGRDAARGIDFAFQQTAHVAVIDNCDCGKKSYEPLIWSEVEQMIGRSARGSERAICSIHMLKSKNRHITDNDCVIRDGDEVAYFPPVTGG